MIRKVIFNKPTIVDVENLPVGAIFFADDEPYMRITEAKDSFGACVNSVSLRGGTLMYWENKDSEEYKIEYFPNYQNIKIVGD